MENNLFNTQQPAQPQITYIADASEVRTFLARVFTYMTLALVLSGTAAWLFATVPSLSDMLRDPVTQRQTILGWVVLFAPLALVFVMGGMVQRLSSTALLGVFVAYSALTGMSLSYIFLIYNLPSIGGIFLISAAVFAIMAIAGYTTKTDLTKLGSILFIGLIGIVVAGLVNAFFLKSGTMGYIISMLSVVIFTGLTAYDMQKLKTIGSTVVNGTELAQKAALMGALSLYLDFLNLFLALLRLFGGRRN